MLTSSLNKVGDFMSGWGKYDGGAKFLPSQHAFINTTCFKAIKLDQDHELND